MKTKQIIEGSTKLIVPALKEGEIPENAKVFYNPKMEFDRTLSINVLKTYFDKEAKILDLLSGLGARAVRYANEAGFEITANDVQPSATKLIEQNAGLNNVNIDVSNKEANLFMLENKYKFNCVDIDPFGSPINFLTNSFRALKPKNSLLMVTATDLGTLSGAYKRACFRRYGIMSDRSSFSHELGLRNLIYAVYREGALQEYSIEPLLSYAREHYYRMFLKVRANRKYANKNMKQIGFIGYCRKCENRKTFPIYAKFETECKCGKSFELFGPTWIGKVGHSDFVKKIKEKNVFLSRLGKELDFSELYVDVNEVARVNKKLTPKIDRITKQLEEQGYRTVRTHLSKYGIKTNASFDIVEKIILD